MRYLKLFENYEIINCLLINSKDMTIDKITINSDDNKIKEIIGNECERYAATIRFENGDYIFYNPVIKKSLIVDEEGMYDPSDYGFFVEGYDRNNKIYVMYGNAIVCGVNHKKGAIEDCKTHLLELKEKIIFIEMNDGMPEIRETT